MSVFPLTIRPAAPDDIETMIGIGTASYLSAIDQLPDFRDRKAEIPAAFAGFVPGQVDKSLVAESEGERLGFVSFEAEVGKITDLWVHPACQNRGVGAVLLSSAESVIRAAGRTLSQMTTHVANRRALSFYRTHGYAFLKTSRAQAETVPDLIYTRAHLVKELSRPVAADANTMKKVRRGIDVLDRALVSLLAERFAFIDRAADLKPALNLPARVPSRVEEVVQNAAEQARSIGFDPALTEKLWRNMVEQAIAREEVTMAPEEKREAS